MTEIKPCCIGMMIPDYTLVVGVDREHLKQLKMTLPTWLKHKPDLAKHPAIFFYDRYQLAWKHLLWIYDYIPNTILQAWPPAGVSFDKASDDRFGDPQRVKMLAGFVHVPSLLVDTKYWLKLDTDTVATGIPDWIEPRWFEDNPAIIAHRWGVTKPPEQMLELESYINATGQIKTDPLGDQIVPEPGSEKLKHARIISWCGFFNTEFTRYAARFCLHWKMPVPSQDGFMWYMAERLRYPIVRTNMKDRGWSHWLRDETIREKCEEAMG